MFDHLNMCGECPKVGDVLVIETKRNKGVKILAVAKDVITTNESSEVVLQKGRNKYFNFTMYEAGGSWVNKLWNLGGIKLTSGLNNINMIDDM